MYHGNRLEKVTKDLNPVWVNTCNNFTFSNLLLSKTGSMYFIGSGTTVGKIEANGSLAWIKKLDNSTVTVGANNYTLTNSSGNQLMLDRNDNLVITGTGFCTNQYKQGFFMKMDTSGNILSTRSFGGQVLDVNTFHIINDSAGNYKILSSCLDFESFVTLILNYSEVADSITHISAFGFSADHYGPAVMYYKSKFDSQFYLGVNTTDNNYYTSMAFYKFINFKNTWAYNWGHLWQNLNNFEVLQEDEKGNLFLLAANPSSVLRKGFIGLDSNGIYNGINAKYFNNYPLYPNPAPSSQVHVLYNGNYFFDAINSGFPSNPLSIGYSSMSCINTLPTGSVMATINTGGYSALRMHKATSTLTRRLRHRRRL